jgi:hypothetical protein
MSGCAGTRLSSASLLLTLLLARVGRDQGGGLQIPLLLPLLHLYLLLPRTPLHQRSPLRLPWLAAAVASSPQSLHPPLHVHQHSSGLVSRSPWAARPLCRSQSQQVPLLLATPRLPLLPPPPALLSQFLTCLMLTAGSPRPLQTLSRLLALTTARAVTA